MSTSPDARVNWRQIALITGGAAAVFVALRLLPTGTNLSHMDFRVEGRSQLEFCDPANPQFVPVVAVRSPVVMTLRPDGAPAAGCAVACRLTLRTVGGKAIGPADLRVSHTRRLHLLVVDPTLTDYQHLHPEPAAEAGVWRFAFTPRFGGVYRVFADFTPAATGRSLYATADVAIGGTAAEANATSQTPNWQSEAGGCRFELVPSAPSVRAGAPVDLRLVIARPDGAAVALEPVMGAFAHLVAFDEARSGFAHLHPVDPGLDRPPDTIRPELRFRLTIPQPGRYVVWAQVNAAGREVFVPFRFDVQR
jgi:hypothetical protein